MRIGTPDSVHTLRTTLAEINDLKVKFNTAMILITHDLGVVAETCDDVAIIYAGRIVEFGEKRELFKHPKHPYTVGLFGSVPKLDDESDRLSPIPGLPPDPTKVVPGCAFADRCVRATEECRKAPVEMAAPEKIFWRCRGNGPRGGRCQHRRSAGF